MEIEIKDFNKLNLGPYKEQANKKREFYREYCTKVHKDYAVKTLSYEDWRDWRWNVEHQERTRADEKWFAHQVGGTIKGTGKKDWTDENGEEFKKDFGDGYVGEKVEPGKNNFDGKVTYQDKDLNEVAFQQYRPNDPIGFICLLNGHDPKDYTLFVIPKAVLLEMKKYKILKTGKLGGAHTTGIYENMTIQEKVNSLGNQMLPPISFSIKRSNKNNPNEAKHFQYIMDNHRFRLNEVKDYILNFDHTKEIVL